MNPRKQKYSAVFILVNNLTGPVVLFLSTCHTSPAPVVEVHNKHEVCNNELSVWTVTPESQKLRLQMLLTLSLLRFFQQLGLSDVTERGYP